MKNARKLVTRTSYNAHKEVTCLFVYVFSLHCCCWDPVAIIQPIYSSLRRLPCNMSVVSQSELSTELSSSCLHLLPRLPVTSIFVFYVSLNNVFYGAVSTRHLTNPRGLPSYFM